MDSYDATRALFTRIQTIDPDNASKIMGFLLIQDQGDNHILRLSFGPDTLILSAIARAKADLGISQNTPSATAPPPQPPTTTTHGPNSPPTASPFSIPRPSPLSLPLSSPTPAIRFNPSSPSSPSLSPLSGSNGHPMSPATNHALSYAAVVSRTNAAANGPFSPSISSSSTHNPFSNSNRENFVDDYHPHHQTLSYLCDPLALPSESVDFFDQSLDFSMSPSCRSDSVLFPYSTVEDSQHSHRRSCSVNDVSFGGAEDSTSRLVYKPCLFFQRGWCKNGSTCKFVHAGGVFPQLQVAGKFDTFDKCQQELMRSTTVTPQQQQQRLAAPHFMAGVNFPYNKLDFLHTEAQRSAANALVMGEEFHKLNRCRVGMSEYSGMVGGADINPGSRQIYLTFPADSTFREEDVTIYFSIYGPVEDVRIPYQQKRMFGFVTFVYPETVKIILAKGNPHFVCDSRVLVKPYKEKGKLPDKKQQQQQQSERGQFTSCPSPSTLDCRESFDIQLDNRSRMLCNNTQEMLWRRKLEQQALELQGRRLMNMQLMDLASHYQPQNCMSVGSPIPSPHHHSVSHPSIGFAQDASEENEGKGSSTATPDGQLPEEVNAAAIDGSGNANGTGTGSGKDDNSNDDECDLPESLEHILPDNLFSSPTKSSGERRSIFSLSSPSFIDVGAGISSSGIANNDPLMTTTSSLSRAHFKSCFLEMPRLSSGHGAVGM